LGGRARQRENYKKLKKDEYGKGQKKGKDVRKRGERGLYIPRKGGSKGFKNCGGVNTGDTKAGSFNKNIL